MKKKTNLIELTKEVDSVISSYDWDKNEDNLGLLMITSNDTGCKVGIVGQMQNIANALTKGMLNDKYVRDAVLAAYNTFVNFLAEGVDIANKMSSPKAQPKVKVNSKLS